MPGNKPGEVPWVTLGADVVIDATGHYLKRRELEKHLQAGAKRVIVSRTPEDDIDRIVINGVNDDSIQASDQIISATSSTTQVLALMLKILDQHYSVKRALMTTIHAYTADQPLADAVGVDLRRSRSAVENIIPNTTGAPEIVEKLMPEFAGKLDGIAFNVPVPNGSCVDLTTELEIMPAVEEVNQVIKQEAENGYAEAQTRLGGLLYEGSVLKQDLKLGMDWIRKAAVQNYAPAESALATIFINGLVDGPDYTKSALWARRGAMQGDPLAQRTLGELYRKGKGVIPSKLPEKMDHKRQAFKWLKLAEKGGVSGLGPILNDLQKQMEPSDIRRALNEASQFVPLRRYDPEKKNAEVEQSDDLEELTKEANKGKGMALLELARRFNKGRGVKKDSIESYKWYTLAFNQGEEDAFLERSEMKKSHGMTLDDIVEAKKRVRLFKPKL